ncbi:hypothetical protein EBZ37_14830, partial [bacterium]|nr:hypothetical protein [bacterium]
MSRILIDSLRDVETFLSQFYALNLQYDISQFVLPSDDSLGLGGHVILNEQQSNAYLALQFGTQIEQCVLEQKDFAPNTLAVLAEEVSHFHLLVDACETDSKISTFELEVQGEIDRFLALLYWNEWFLNRRKLKLEFKNLQELCDHVFEGQRFRGQVTQLYPEAESLAFYHLKNAFSKTWDNSYFNFSEVNPFAQSYLRNLRKTILEKSVSQWLVSA